MITITLFSVPLLAKFAFWPFTGPLLLFFGLLTLVNAPFDWVSLGLTRALLRRGLELGGWWPFFFALLDAALAAVIIAVLVIAMVIAVQVFDALAAGRGGPILPLRELLDGIAANPSAPEFWWAYALLLATVVPSFLNLVIGGASLLRGVPGLQQLLLRFATENKPVLAWDRHWMAAVLTAQIGFGALLGILAQVAVVFLIIGRIMPALGLGLLEMARGVAELNLPLWVEQLFGLG